eukprot:TRINITY_DN1070_c1_g2_i1.p2 TRINITY_DN1070_c1_g2~~TRINITY_DN1070_c1_g2_i1.p2  ORF type:complete len:217 (-),score=92.07 TRINITY_DN1070_c1_g2_i1:18-668(-)
MAHLQIFVESLKDPLHMAIPILQAAPPIDWWTHKDDGALLTGVYRYGFGRYDEMRYDPDLFWFGKVTLPDLDMELAQIEEIMQQREKEGDAKTEEGTTEGDAMTLETTTTPKEDSKKPEESSSAANTGDNENETNKEDQDENAENDDKEGDAASSGPSVNAMLLDERMAPIAEQHVETNIPWAVASDEKRELFLQKTRAGMGRGNGQEKGVGKRQN